MRPLTRIEPALPVQAYQTFQVLRPPATHLRPARCAEVGCPFADGWQVVVDEATMEGRRRAHYLRYRAGRRFVERRNAAGLTVFTFGRGQRCFRNHVVPVPRPALHIVRGGDWRRDLGVIRRHTRPEHWVEDMAGQLDRLATHKRRG